MQNTIGYKHRQVFADFLQRIPTQGWTSEAKPIPVPTKNYHKPFFAFTFQLSPHHRDGQAKRSQSLLKYKNCRRPQRQPIHKRKSEQTPPDVCRFLAKDSPNRDGQAKRSQSLFLQKNYHKPFFAFTFQLSPHHQGWASEAKPIPTPTKEENKSEQTQQNYSYHLSHFTSKNIQLWKKKNSKISNSCFATAKALSIKSHSEKTTN